jgi:hypothetical protein
MSYSRSMAPMEEMPVVPSVELSPQTFARLQAHAVPLADNIETIIGRLIDFRAIKNGLAGIGEAVKSLLPELFARHRALDWRGFAGLPDLVSH